MVGLAVQARVGGEMIGIAALIGSASALYAMAGQAGGTAFLAVMAFAAFPVAEMRPTALTLNVVAASYATWRQARAGAIDWTLFWRVTAASLPAALLGGALVLSGRSYLALTGCLLIVAAALMVLRRQADAIDTPVASRGSASLAGGGTGFLSGLTGVGGGVFLAPLLIFLGWTTPKRAAGLSAPFILVNSLAALVGVLAVGQRPAPDTLVYAGAALLGAVVGTAIGLRWLSQAATRYVLAVILLLAGTRLLSL